MRGRFRLGEVPEASGQEPAFAVGCYADAFVRHARPAGSGEPVSCAAADQIGKSELSAEQQQMSSDKQQLTSLQSTVDGLASDPLSAYSSMGRSNGGGCDISTGQKITAYYPCTDKNPD
jgi:hypothetical protein